MKKINWIILLICFLFSQKTSAGIKHSAADPAISFSKIDSNHSGVVSAAGTQLSHYITCFENFSAQFTPEDDQQEDKVKPDLVALPFFYQFFLILSQRTQISVFYFTPKKSHDLSILNSVFRL